MCSLVAVGAQEFQIVFVDPNFRIVELVEQNLEAIRKFDDRDIGSDIVQRLSGVKTLSRIRVQLTDALQSSDDPLERLS